MALRTPLSVTPHLYMGDSTGRPLDKGVVYFGEQDKDPEFYPINLFSDDALTLPLAQPVHTKGGYLYDKGDMVEPHAKELIYSVKVLDSYGRKVFYKGAMMRNSWNDDVIEQINAAIIGSADVARQVAADITNEAINNTAAPGGILADTFVTATAYGSGSIARTQREVNAERVNVHDFGAIGDGTLHTLQEWIDNGRYSSLIEIQAEHPTARALTDSVDRVSMQSCIDYCKNIGATAYAVEGKKYFIDETLIIRSNVDFSDCETTTPETFAGAAFYLGNNPDNPELVGNLRVKLPKIRSTREFGTAWTSGSVGVKIEGVRNAVIYFDNVSGFETNLLLYSNAVGIYQTANNFHFKATFHGSKTNIKFLIEDSGWVNQSQFWGGHFAVISTDSQAFSDIRNIEMIKVGSGGNNPPNGNTFIGSNLEGGGFEYAIYQSYPEQVSSFVSNNRWISCRFESTKKLLFDTKAINDTLLCPHLDKNVIFEGKKPEIIGDYYRGQINIFSGIGVDDGLERTADNSYHISGGTTGSNLISTWGATSSYYNAGVTATGNFQVYDNSDVTKKHPNISLGKRYYPGLSMGSGSDVPVERLYRQGENDWRISSSLNPSDNNSVSLGKSGLAYSSVHANVFRGTSGMGLWSVAPPTSKPDVTGLKTPTTIAEQKVVTDSLIAALASYGLITDSRT